MRIGSEAPKRRTQSSSRHESQGAPPPRTVIGVPSQADGQSRNCRGAFQRPPFIVPDAKRRRPAQCPAARAATGRSEACAPSASAAGALGAGSKPPHQGAVLLVHKEPPRQLDHASPNSTIAGTGQPFLPAFSTALVGRAREAGITGYGPPVAHVS